MSREKRLGRGLDYMLQNAPVVEDDYLFGSDLGVTPRRGGGTASYRIDSGTSETPADEVLGELMRDKQSYDIPIALIDRNPRQPRLDFDERELADLAESIKKHGMFQPVVVRQTPQRRFELIAGERRLRAARLAEWEKVPAHILIVDDREMAEIALTENLQRRDLNAIEKAVAFRDYINVYGGTNDELAKRLDLDRSTICNLIRLLDLPEEIQQMVRRDELSMGHVRPLLGIKEERQLEAAEKMRAEKWSVRQAEEYTKELKQDAAAVDGANKRIGPRKATIERSAHLDEMESRFRSFFGTRVKLTANAKGKGKLVIPFNSNEEFERIYQMILPRME